MESQSTRQRTLLHAHGVTSVLFHHLLSMSEHVGIAANTTAPSGQTSRGRWERGQASRSRSRGEQVGAGGEAIGVTQAVGGSAQVGHQAEQGLVLIRLPDGEGILARVSPAHAGQQR